MQLCNCAYTKCNEYSQLYFLVTDAFYNVEKNVFQYSYNHCQKIEVSQLFCSRLNSVLWIVGRWLNTVPAQRELGCGEDFKREQWREQNALRSTWLKLRMELNGKNEWKILRMLNQIRGKKMKRWQKRHQSSFYHNPYWTLGVWSWNKWNNKVKNEHHNKKFRTG